MMSVQITACCSFTLTVVAGCLVPAGRLPSRLSNDKLFHLLSFAMLSLPVAAVAPTAEWTVAGAVILLLGIAVEIVQHFNPGCSFCGRDLIANAAGLLIGTTIGRTVAL